MAVLALLRLAHVGLLWSDEDYHLAAALNVLNGKIPYRDFWYDKPPLAIFYYLLIGAHPGWTLRLLDALYVSLACWLAFRLASNLWSRTEGLAAAGLLAFFLTFYLPAAVIPFAADALLLVPHLAAVAAAQRKCPLQAGAWSAVGFLLNAKGLFVLASCAAWLLPQLLWLTLGFFLPLLIGLFAALASGAWPGYFEQVWRWGLLYARQSPAANSLLSGIQRTLDWIGFHVCLVAGTAIAFLQRLDLRLLFWVAISFAAVCLGHRFVPRYFLQLLPPLTIVAARGLTLAHQRYGRRALVPIAALLLIPLIRFGPRYIELANADIRGVEPHWADVALDEDSRRVAAIISASKSHGDSLFVWGYRPDIYVFTRLTSPGLFSDSQPLTGVPADRHLSVSTPVYSSAAASNRLILVRSHPTYIVDGLGSLNPVLAPQAYPEIRAWLNGYQIIGRTSLSVIYRRNGFPSRQRPE